MTIGKEGGKEDRGGRIGEGGEGREDGKEGNVDKWQYRGREEEEDMETQEWITVQRETVTV